MNTYIESPEALLQEVRKIQERLKLTDQQMAEKIGCSRVLYQRTRTAKIPVGDTFLKGAMKLLSSSAKEGRKSGIKRDTKETSITLEIRIDGNGTYEINTGINIFDHMLSQLAKHGLIDIKLSASGDDPHHIIEDVAICLGKAFNEALGEKLGIVRMADVTIPMDETLVMMAIDIGGRGYAVLDLPFNGSNVSGIATDMVRHFLDSFAIEARINLHASIIRGNNDHHKIEALFKALGRVLDKATMIDRRIVGELPSTKDLLDTYSSNAS